MSMCRFGPIALFRIVLCLLCYACFLFEATASVRINEVMASNASTLADEDGDYEDWIELLNTGSDAIDLTGWGLSDNYSDPFKWTFGGVSIAPGEYLLVWASGKDRMVATNGHSLHTSFSIATAGEEVLLTRPDGSRADELSPRPIPTDLSLGRQPDGSGDWFYFTDPTPAEANTTEGFEAILNPPAFSHSAGFHTNTLELTLSHPDPGVEIVYTLDGSEPMPDRLGGEEYEYKNEYRGTNITPSLFRELRSHLYSEPLAITNRSTEPFELATINTQNSAATVEPEENTFKGTVVRARAFKDGAVASPVVTHTYFVEADMPSRYTLPVISLSADESHLFGYEEGIYVRGGGRPPEPWGQPANFWGRGPEWERSAHMEVFYPDGSPKFTQKLGLRIHGGGSREHRLKSLRLYARSRYGGSTFQHAFFPGLERGGAPGESLESFRRLLLRAAGQDWDSAFYRDPFMHELVEHLPLDRQAYQPAVHFINGEYWGLINIRERLDAHYLAAHYDLAPEDVAILTGWDGQLDTGLEEDVQDFQDIVEYAESYDLGQPEHHDWIRARVDTQNLALYYAARIYFNDWDWPQNNMDWWRKRVAETEPDAPPGHDGRWRWLFYDTDFGYHWYMGPHANGLDRVVNLTPGYSHMGTPVISNRVNRLFRSLVHEQPTFRHEFISIMADQLNTAWHPARVLPLLDEFEERIAPYRAEHNNRWSVNTGPQQRMPDFAEARPGHLRAQIVEVFDLPGTFALTIDTPNAAAGTVRVNDIQIREDTFGLATPLQPYPWTGVYFRTVPVEIVAEPAPGYRFAGWTGLTNSQATVVITPSANTSVTAHFEANEPPVALPSPELHQWIEGSEAHLLPLESFFMDPDGDDLIFDVTSSNTNKVWADIIGDDLQLIPLERGQSWIRLSASDGFHDPVETLFRVLVYPRAQAVATSAWTFDAWSPDHLDGTYPEHLLFLQSNQDDTGLTTSLLHAYSLQPEDYHADDQDTIGFPYNNTGRTRINGLNEQGVAFINTGQGRDLGGALLALDTRDAERLWVKWTAGTVRPNSRVYALRLQYRVGTEGGFLDVPDEEGNPMEYIRHTEAGHEHTFPPVALPESVLGHEYVQLLWRYYRVSGTSGPRAKLRLDNMLVTPFGIDVEVIPSGAGSVSGQQIFAEQDTAELTATPSEHYHFEGWTGDVSGNFEDANPLFLEVTGARDLQAHFGENVTTNTSTPHWWLAQYGLTNGTFEAAAVQDHSGNLLSAWQEYIADLDPTDHSASLPRIHLQTEGTSMLLEVDPTSIRRFYTIKHTTNLTDASSWTVLTNAPGTGSGWIHTLENDQEQSGPSYFRGEISVQP